MISYKGYGEWLWIHDVNVDAPLTHQVAGRTVDGFAVCLPPEFTSELRRSGLTDRVNRRCGTLLDWYEEEDIADAETLAFIAGFVDAAFPVQSDLRWLADDLVAFLMARVRSRGALTFRL